MGIPHHFSQILGGNMATTFFLLFSITSVARTPWGPPVIDDTYRPTSSAPSFLVTPLVCLGVCHSSQPDTFSPPQSRTLFL